jgi:hypothetical protein
MKCDKSINSPKYKSSIGLKRGTQFIELSPRNLAYLTNEPNLNECKLPNMVPFRDAILSIFKYERL